jgi:hypothetical protein
MNEFDLSKYKIQDPEEFDLSRYVIKDNYIDDNIEDDNFERASIEQDLYTAKQRLKQFGLGVLSGFTGGNLMEAADSFGAGVMEVAPEVVAPILPASAIAGAEAAEKGLDSLYNTRPDENDSLGNILYKAGEFGGAAASVPLPGVSTPVTFSKAIYTIPKEIPKGFWATAKRYGIDYPRKGLSYVNKDYTKAINNPFIENSLVGAGSGVLQEGEINPLLADLSSVALTPTLLRTPQHLYNIPKNLKNVGYKTARGLFKINKNNFNMKAANAAERLGLKLNFSELNPSGGIATVNNMVAKNPLSSDSYVLHNRNIGEKIKEVIDENLKLVGPQKTKEVEKLIDTKYAKTRELFPENPEDRMILPEHSVKSLQEGFNTTSLSPSPNETAVMNYRQEILDQLAPGAFIEGKRIEGYTPPIQPIDAKRILETKISLNDNDSLINYNNPNSNIRNNAKKFGVGYRKDLDTLGERYPDWHASLKDADKFFANVAARENFENSLINGGFNYDMFNYQPAMLSRTLNTPKKIKKIQHTYKNKPKTTKEKLDQNLEDLGIISDAIFKSNKSNPNPSGSATTGANLISLGSFASKPSLWGSIKLALPSILYKTVVNNDKLLKDTIDTLKNKKPKIPFNYNPVYKRTKNIYPIVTNDIKNKKSEKINN